MKQRKPKVKKEFSKESVKRFWGDKMSDKEKLKSMELQIIDLKREVESLKKTHKHDCLKDNDFDWVDHSTKDMLKCCVCNRCFGDEGRT